MLSAHAEVFPLPSSHRAGCCPFTRLRQGFLRFYCERERNVLAPSIVGCKQPGFQDVQHLKHARDPDANAKNFEIVVCVSNDARIPSNLLPMTLTPIPVE